MTPEHMVMLGLNKVSMRNNLVRFAFVAGLLPLIIGSIVILVYWLNDYAAMHLVAFFTGLACLILVLLGLVAVFCALNT